MPTLSRIRLGAIVLVVLMLKQTIAMCPNWCSQRGICTTPAQGGYCDCDMGYTGDDCGKTYCPYAFEPLALERSNARRTIRLKTEVEGGVMMGRLALTFAGATVVFEANAAKVDSIACQSAMSQLKSIAEVQCERQALQAATGTGTYLITLQRFPEKPHFNNLVSHKGNPPMSMFYCNTTLVDLEEASSPRCFLEDVPVLGEMPQYLECAGHGDCDTSKGKCACKTGFHGIACDDTRDSYDIMSHKHDGPFFTGTLLKLHTQRTESGEFNVLQAQINNKNVTTLRGDRLLDHQGYVQVSQGIAIGMSYDPTGVFHEKNEIQWRNTAHLRSNIHNSSEAQIQGLPLPHHIAAYFDHQPVFVLTAEGGMTAHGGISAGNGSFVVSPIGATSVHNLSVSESMMVGEHLQVGSGLSVGNVYHMGAQGMTIALPTPTPHDSSPSSSSSSSRIPQALLTISSMTPGSSALRGTQKDKGSTTSSGSFNSTLLSLRAPAAGTGTGTGTGTGSKTNVAAGNGVANGVLIEGVVGDVPVFQVTNDGFMHTHGLKMRTGGVEVEAGGVYVGAGGLKVNGGLTIESGTLSMPGRTLSVGGLSILATSGGAGGSSISDGKASLTSSSSTSTTSTLLSLASESPLYSGQFIDLMVPLSNPPGSPNTSKLPLDSAQFSFFVARRGSSSGVNGSGGADKDAGKSGGNGGVDDVVYRVGADGSVYTRSGIQIAGEMGLSVTGPSSLQGGLSLAQVKIKAGATISIHAGGMSAFVMIVDDGVEAKNELVVGGTESQSGGGGVGGGLREGQVLIIANRDAQPTSGIVRIPSGSCVMILYDGVKWVDLQALHAPVEHLQGVKSFHAASDLSIGHSRTFAAGRLQSTQLVEGRVPMVGIGGVLTDSDQLMFTHKPGGNSLLTTPALKVGELTGDVDVKGFEIKNAVLVNAKLKETSMTDSHIHAASLVLPSLSNAALLSTDANGRVTRASEVRIGHVMAEEKLTLSPEASLVMKGLGGVNTGGGDGGVSLLVITDPNTGIVGGKTLSELLRGVKTGIDGLTLSGATITSSTIKLHTSPGSTVFSGSTKGTLVVQAPEGHLVTASGGSLTAEGTLSIAAIQPLPSLLGTNVVTIASADLSDPRIKGGSMTAIKTITSDTLEVTNKAVFGGKDGTTFTGPAVFQGNVEVSKSGTLHTHQIEVGSTGLSVTGPSSLHGGLSLAQVKIKAGATIAIDIGASAFVTVVDDGGEAKNEVTVQAPADGQALFLCNQDQQALTGIAQVPPQTCAFLLHNFETMEWQIISQHTPSPVVDTTTASSIDTASLEGKGALVGGELTDDVDVKGFEVKNAVLVNATLATPVITGPLSTSTLVVTDLKGMSLLATDAQGKVQGVDVTGEGMAWLADTQALKALTSELSALRAEVKTLQTRLEQLEQDKASTASVQGQGLPSAAGQELEPEKITEGTPPVETKVEVEVAAV